MLRLIFLLSFSASAFAQNFNIDFDFSIGALPPVVATPPPIDEPTPITKTEICTIATANGLSCDVVLNIIKVESNYKTDAERFEKKEFNRLKRTRPHIHPDELIDLSTSYGLMQVMGYHAETETCDMIKRPIDLLDPRKNVECGVAILRALTRRCGDTIGAVAAYNCGSCNNRESSYVKKVL